MAVGRIEMHTSVPEHIRHWVASVVPGQEEQLRPRTAIDIYKDQLRKAGITGPTFDIAVVVFSRQLPKEVVRFSNPISDLIRTAETLGFNTAPYKELALKWAQEHKKGKVIMRGEPKAIFSSLQNEVNTYKGNFGSNVNMFDRPGKSSNEVILHDKNP